MTQQTIPIGTHVEPHAPPHPLIAALFRTDVSNRYLAFQRVVLGLAMLPHGAQKLLGWFGGEGFHATLANFTTKMHIPAPLAVLVILSESIGSVMMVFGLLTRVCALGTTAIMLVAIAMVHGKNGFFMNWFGQQAGEGIEYHVLALALAIPILIAGAGRWSLDASIARGLESHRA